MLGCEGMDQSLRSPDHLLRISTDEGIVRRNIRLALTGVNDDIVHLAQCGEGLHVCGECGAAHTHDTCIPDDAEDLVSREILVGQMGL